MALAESVCNFSTSDPDIIRKLKNAICRNKYVAFLHESVNLSANRTVLTFCAPPKPLLQAMFRAIECAQRHIDLRNHVGVHPKIGACDVCPIVPIQGLTIQDCHQIALRLGEKVGAELGIPVYLYEESARQEYRKKLSQIRRGGRETFLRRLSQTNWKPDFGPSQPNESIEKSGGIAIGARSLMIAWNISLNSNDEKIAKKMAAKLRESGFKRKGSHYPGRFKGLRAIGWRIAEYNCVQVSMNIYDIHSAPMANVWEYASELAKAESITLKESELIGLIPKQPLLIAGAHWGKTAPEQQIATAASQLRLGNFQPSEHILEYNIEKHTSRWSSM